MTQKIRLTVQAVVNAPVAHVWNVWNTPSDIMQWNAADPSWHTPASENDLRVGGRFRNRMEAKDGSFGFDFEGVYDRVQHLREISYTMPDGRQVTTLFHAKGAKTDIVTAFDAETQNAPEFQQQGWQAILNSFVRYAESTYAQSQ